MDILFIIICCIGIFFAGMFVILQYSIDSLNWITSKEFEHIFFIHSSNEIRFRFIWGIIAAIVFMICLIMVI